MIAKLKEVLDRVQGWPLEAQEEAVQTLLAIEEGYADLAALSDDDRVALARSAEDVRLGRLATDEQVEEVLARHRRA